MEVGDEGVVALTGVEVFEGGDGTRTSMWPPMSRVNRMMERNQRRRAIVRRSLICSFAGATSGIVGNGASAQEYQFKSLVVRDGVRIGASYGWVSHRCQRRHTSSREMHCDRAERESRPHRVVLVGLCTSCVASTDCRLFVCLDQWDLEVDMSCHRPVARKIILYFDESATIRSRILMDIVLTSLLPEGNKISGECRPYLEERTRAAPMIIAALNRRNDRTGGYTW